MNAADGEMHAKYPGIAAHLTEMAASARPTPAARTDDSAPARLSDALLTDNTGISLGDSFFDTVFRAAMQAGCELLFEIPPALFDGKSSRAAALRGRAGPTGEEELFFVLFNEKRCAVTIVEATEAGESVVDFTRSYASVLSLIGSDSRLVRPVIQ